MRTSQAVDNTLNLQHVTVTIAHRVKNFYDCHCKPSYSIEIISDGVLSVETRDLSQDSLKVFMSRSWLNLDNCMSCLGSVLSFHVSSCLVSHDCVLTVSLSGIAKCLFCVETLSFLAQSRLLGPFARCLLAYCKTAVLVHGCCCFTAIIITDETFRQPNSTQP